MKQPPEPCREPFTPCWCESRPNNPNCKDVDNVPIDNGLYLLIIAAIILIFKFNK